MKRIFIYMMMAIGAAAAVSCAEEVDKNVEWPEWASRPILTDLSVSATDGSKAIVAGENVRFTAKVKDEFNELSKYTLQVKYADNVVFSMEEPVSGSEAELDVEFVMPFAAYLSDGEFYPEISLSVTNVVNGSATLRVSKENNVALSRPSIPEKLYIVDNAGGVVELIKDNQSFIYRTAEGSDLSKIGTSFHIAAKVNGKSPDYSDFVWGESDGKISVLPESGTAIKTPDSSGKGFKYLGFDIYSFKIDKLVNHVVTFDRNNEASQDQGGITYLAKERVKLIKDCEIVFEGFGDLKSMLQPDRFEILSEKSAKFLGHTATWSIYYDTADNWLIVNYADFHAPDQIWVTGAKACFPLGNNESTSELKYLAGDGKHRVATLSTIKDDNGNERILVYLKDGFVIQLFTRVKWAAEVALNSLTQDFGVIVDGKFINPGQSFTPGVYELVLTETKADDADGIGAVMDVSLIPYELK